jgi:hypothetical protein
VRVTLNFHPDRLVRGAPILRALAEDGAYHSQFVKGTSHGGLTAQRRQRPPALGEPDLRRGL